MWQLSFLDGAFLWGALLVGVPLVLHLAMRRQPRHLEFPALRFIQKRETANRRQLKLRHLVLLALRMAFIALLAAALARPSLQGSGWLGDQEAPVAAAFVFDTSPRMQYRHHNQTRLETARETGLWLLSQLPRDSEVAVIDARYGSNVFAVDLGAAKQRIERLDASPIGSPLATTFGDSLRLVGTSNKQRKEVYVFTDLARSSWSAAATQTLQKQLAEYAGVGLYVIDVGVEQPQNVGILDLRLSSEAVSKGTPLQLQVDLVHDGSPTERTVELYLLDDSQTPAKRSQETVKFEGGDLAQVDFRLAGLEPGVHQGYVKIDGEDALAADDMHYFTVEVTPAWKILLAAPQPTDDYTFFLSEALAPYAFRIKGEAAFRCDTVLLGELLKKPLNEYAAVCLLDPTPLADDAWQRLADYASGGGGVAIFLGRNAKPVESFNDPAAQQVLPAKLLRQWRAGDRDVHLTPDHLEHPLLAKFRPMETAVPWNASPVYTHWELGPLNAGARSVIPFSNGLPALVEQPVGRGRVLTLATPVSDDANRNDAWNLLPTEESWPFMILANEMMYYLAGSTHSKLNYAAGETAVVRLATDQHHSIFSLLSPNGESIRQSVDERQNAIVATGTDQAGNYRLAAGGEAEGTHLGFSVNLPANVSQLERAAPDELKAIFGGTPFRVARNREEIVRDVNFGRVGRELYPLLMVLVVLVLAAEQLLANRFYGSRDTKTASAAASFVKDRATAAEAKISAAPPLTPAPPPLPASAVTP
jgi:hypothetical protein